MQVIFQNPSDKVFLRVCRQKKLASGKGYYLQGVQINMADEASFDFSSHAAKQVTAF
jgi:hypothetical protein